jgi:putative ABC transport system ATP-binding protein
MKPIIKIENMSVVYNPGKTTEFVALQNINLEIFPEEYVVFFGPSGSGKSTLLYVIAGLENPTTGKVTVSDDRDITTLSEEELIAYHQTSVGMIFQAFYLIPSLSAQDNIVLPMVFAGEPAAKRLEKAKPIMDRFGITSYKDRTPSKMSGGQQQRVAIARSLINDPPVVLADEPVGNLDSKNANIVLDLIANLRRRDKKTVIHVTHNPAHLDRADRIYHLRDGKIVRETSGKASDGGLPPQPGSLRLHAPAGEKWEWIKDKRDSELSRLAHLYPHISEERLRAKLILNHVLLPYDHEVMLKIEAVVEKFLSRGLTEEDLVETFDLPPEKGGINLYSQTAKTLASQISELANEIHLIEEVSKFPEANILHTTRDELRKHLLDHYEGVLTQTQQERLGDFLELRVKDRIGSVELRKALDAPLSEGGVGLNRRTARKFTRDAEVMLMNTTLPNHL